MVEGAATVTANRLPEAEGLTNISRGVLEGPLGQKMRTVLDEATIKRIEQLADKGLLDSQSLNSLASIVEKIRSENRTRPGGMTAAQLKEALSGLFEIAENPDEFNQGLHATCTSVAMGRDSARNDKAFFISTSLQFLNTGSMKGRNGVEVDLNTTALNPALDDPKGNFDHCTLFERLYAASLTQYAVGKLATYDHRTGASSGKMGGGDVEGLVGLTPSQYCRIREWQTGVPQTVVKGDAAKATLIAQKPGQQLPLLCDIGWGPQGTKDACHMVLVTKIVGLKIDDNGKVIGGVILIENPHGSFALDVNRPPGVESAGGKGIQRIPAAEFFARLNRVVVPVGSGTPPAPAITPDNDPVLQGIIAGTQGPKVHYELDVGRLLQKPSIQPLTSQKPEKEEEGPNIVPVDAETNRPKKVVPPTEEPQDPWAHRRRMAQSLLTRPSTT